MPRKIKVENLNEMPEAEGMNAVREEMKSEVVEEAVAPKSDDKSEVAVVAPKATAKGRAKKPEPAVVAEPEPVVEDPRPAKPEKVSCPDCGKMVSAKTLKYTHKANCKASQPKYSEVHSGACYQEDDLESRVEKVKRQRAQSKQERISQLAAQAF